MKDRKRVIAQALVKEAEESGRNESYKILEKKPYYRVSIGAKLETPCQPSFFIEVIVPICEPSTAFQLNDLELRMIFVKKLSARGYSLSCQDNIIACEVIIPRERLKTERRTISSIAKRIFGKETRVYSRK